MAGNIVPAIATTNAVTAGVVVLRTFNVLRQKLDECQSVYLRRFPDTKKRVLVAERVMLLPNPNCYICAQPDVVLYCNIHKLTIKDLEEQVFKKTLNLTAPDVMVPSIDNVRIVISSEEGEMEENNAKTLIEMGIDDRCQLEADDYLQNFKINVLIRHYEAEKDMPEFKIESRATADAPPPIETAKNGEGAEECDDDVIVVEDVKEVSIVQQPKRKLADDAVRYVPLKKRAYDHTKNPQCSSSL